MRAFVTLRNEPHYRRDAFVSGLSKLGYEIHGQPRDNPKADDVLVIWNRYAHNDRLAETFERVGARVLVAENGFLGREWIGGKWYAVSGSYHNGAGFWPDGDEGRWDSLGIRLDPWRTRGKEIVILAQRGIGPEKYREPPGWPEKARQLLAKRSTRDVRVREHPGERRPKVPLEEDLEHAWAVVCWASGAALKALMMGIPVFYGMEKWIGGGAGLPFTGNCELPLRNDECRLNMFRRLAHAMWTTDELQTGEPFKNLLACP